MKYEKTKAFYNINNNPLPRYLLALVTMYMYQRIEIYSQNFTTFASSKNIKI